MKHLIILHDHDDDDVICCHQIFGIICIYYSDLGLIINSDKLCLDEMSSGWWFPIPTDYIYIYHNVAYVYSQWITKAILGMATEHSNASLFLEKYSSNNSTSPKKGGKKHL